MRLFLSTALMLMLFACSDKTSNVDSDNKNKTGNELGELVDRVHHCSRLEVAEYTMLKTVSFDDKSKLYIAGHGIPLPGERKLMIPIEVKMKMFVDLDLLSENDVTMDSSAIHFSLPSPKLEIYSTKIVNEKEQESVSWFRANFTEQERESFIKQGIEDVKRNLPSVEVTDIAKRNTEKMLQPIITNNGFRQSLYVTFKELELNRPTLMD